MIVKAESVYVQDSRYLTLRGRGVNWLGLNSEGMGVLKPTLRWIIGLWLEVWGF